MTLWARMYIILSLRNYLKAKLFVYLWKRVGDYRTKTTPTYLPCNCWTPRYTPGTVPCAWGLGSRRASSASSRYVCDCATDTVHCAPGSFACAPLRSHLWRQHSGSCRITSFRSKQGRLTHFCVVVPLWQKHSFLACVTVFHAKISFAVFDLLCLFNHRKRTISFFEYLYSRQLNYLN